MKIILSYQTQQLPPPYEFAIVASMEVTDHVSIDFQMEYLGRDELTPEEIHAEGFTENDDIKWEGDLSSNWIEPLKLLKNFQYHQEPHSGSYIHVELEGNQKGFPSDWAKAERLVQELIQAVLEASSREHTLKVEIMDESNHTLEVEWIFMERLVRKSSKNRLISWEKGQQLLNAIYAIDYHLIKPASKPSRRTINPGDGLWYPLSKSDWNRLQQFTS